MHIIQSLNNDKHIVHPQTQQETGNDWMKRPISQSEERTQSQGHQCRQTSSRDAHARYEGSLLHSVEFAQHHLHVDVDEDVADHKEIDVVPDGVGGNVRVAVMIIGVNSFNYFEF